MRIFRYISIITLLIVLALYLRSTFSDFQEFGGEIFNTYYSVKIRTPLSDKTISQKVKDTLEDVNDKMSVFREDSEISRLNNTPAQTSFALSEGLAELLRCSALVNKESKGAFDPAVAPLIDLWGFGPNHQYQEPSAEEISKMLSYSKFNKLKFSPDYRQVIKQDSRTSLNLSAIAKGYAVDKIASTLEEAGFNDYIVEIGGEVRLSGNRDDKGGLWKIGVGVPLKDSQANAMAIELTDYAVATSGDYHNFIEKEGKTFSHTISPQTGRPVENALASATVFAPTCMEADAYATAIMSLGAEDGKKLADKLKLPVIFFIHNEEGGFSMQTSAQAKELIGIDYEAN